MGFGFGNINGGLVMKRCKAGTAIANAGAQRKPGLTLWDDYLGGCAGGFYFSRSNQGYAAAGYIAKGHEIRLHLVLLQWSIGANFAI
jgi:hypothetical protein